MEKGTSYEDEEDDDDDDDEGTKEKEKEKSACRGSSAIARSERAMPHTWTLDCMQEKEREWVSE